MEMLYRVMYRLGITPWDNPRIPPALTSSVDRSARSGVALGCGTGGGHACPLEDLEHDGPARGDPVKVAGAAGFFATPVIVALVIAAIWLVPSRRRRAQPG